MNCAYHSDRPVQGICSTCGRPVCDDCLVSLADAVHCKKCLETKMKKPAREVKGGLRFLLSIVPGVGHMYMGLMNRGLQFFFGTWLASVLVGMLFEPFLGLVIPAAIFFSIFDAREAHLRLDQGLEVEDKGLVDLKTWQFDWNPKYVGYGLVIVGGIILYNTLLSDFLGLFIYDMMVLRKVKGMIQGSLLGVAAIFGGLYLLKKNASA